MVINRPDFRQIKDSAFDGMASVVWRLICHQSYHMSCRWISKIGWYCVLHPSGDEAHRPARMDRNLLSVGPDGGSTEVSEAAPHDASICTRVSLTFVCTFQ